MDFHLLMDELTKDANRNQKIVDDLVLALHSGAKCLFLVCPLSYRGKLVQYIGRVQREAKGKEAAYVFDYADMEVPMLKGMYFKHLRAAH